MESEWGTGVPRAKIRVLATLTERFTFYITLTLRKAESFMIIDLHSPANFHRQPSR